MKAHFERTPGARTGERHYDAVPWSSDRPVTLVRTQLEAA